VALSQPSRPGHGRALETALALLPQVRHRVRVLPAPHPMACTVGLWHPQIVLSAGLVTALTPAEIRAVLGHEWAHVRRRDPLRLVVLRFWQDALWFLPIGRALAREFLNSRALIYLSGFITLLLGLLVVVFHNVWVAGWPVIVTIFGWIMVAAGIARMTIPDRLTKLGERMIASAPFLTGAAILYLALGALLSFFGYRA
jgi:hypothetical protein